MLDRERNPLTGLVEVDKASLPFRIRNDPPKGRRGSSHDGKMPIIGARELGDGNTPGRRRLAELSPYGAVDIRQFLETATGSDATIKTESWRGYVSLPSDQHQVHVAGDTPAHLIFPWIHQIHSNLKGWARGVYHGLRRMHLQACLDEFASGSIGAELDTPPSVRCLPSPSTHNS